MEYLEIKNRLEAILAKINDNTCELWHDDLETTSLCVKLERGALESSWKSDLLTLVAELDRETEEVEEPRTCDHCKKEMKEGYLVNDTEYYCSDECLHEVHTPEEYKEMYDNDEAFWTQWE